MEKIRIKVSPNKDIKPKFDGKMPDGWMGGHQHRVYVLNKWLEFLDKNRVTQ